MTRRTRGLARRVEPERPRIRPITPDDLARVPAVDPESGLARLAIDRAREHHAAEEGGTERIRAAATTARSLVLAYVSTFGAP